MAGAPLAAAAEAQEVTLAPEAALPLAEVPEAAPPAPAAPQRASLRQTAEALLAAWDGNDGERLAAAMAVLRTTLAGKSARIQRDTAAPRQPRQGTKQEAVLALLRRAEGATVGQIADATGWQQHTVRGFFAGLKKRGIDVAVLERVRQVGPDKQGAKGSYSVYCIAAAA